MRQSILVLVAASVVMTACRPVGDVVELSETVEISPYRAEVEVEADPAKRLGFVTSSAAKKKEEAPNTAAKVQNPLTWELPNSWKEMPQSRFRVINASFGEGEKKGECYVTFLPGQAGGVPANLNRWRAQMGLPALTPEELLKLERRPFLRGEAFFIDMEGDYSGMGNNSTQQGYRMLALIQEMSGLTGFVKLIAPSGLVEKQYDNFDAFVQSIQFRERKSSSKTK